MLAGLTDLGQYAIRRVRGMAQPGDPVLQVRVTLADVDDPPAWRRVLIPASCPVHCEAHVSAALLAVFRSTGQPLSFPRQGGE